jgi:hypothetical protein
MTGLESCIECANFQKKFNCFNKCLNFSHFKPLNRDIIEFEDKATDLAKYPRLISKSRIIRTATLAIKVDYNTFTFTRTRIFQGKSFKKERKFNTKKHLEEYINRTYGRVQNLDHVNEQVTIGFEISYHYGRKKIYIEIFKRFSDDELGEMKFFDTLEGLKQFISERYKTEIKIPKAAEQKLRKAEKKIKPNHRTIDDFTEAEN